MRRSPRARGVFSRIRQTASAVIRNHTWRPSGLSSAPYQRVRPLGPGRRRAASGDLDRVLGRLPSDRRPTAVRRARIGRRARQPRWRGRGAPLRGRDAEERGERPSAGTDCRRRGPPAGGSP